MKFLFVCIGNINRSKAAEIIARTYGVEAKSCGLNEVSGTSSRLTKQMSEALNYEGYDHNRELERSQTITQELFDWADVVIAMTNKIAGDIFTRGGINPDSTKVMSAKCLIGEDIRDPHFDSTGRLHYFVVGKIEKLVKGLKDVRLDRDANA